MSDAELRAYVMTAVATHASKELRRRMRKPAGQLDSTHEQVLTDRHLPLPEEAALATETASIARDVLSSLPPRRRAVMLLRYGWGLTPNEVCDRVVGLSPRAYRKEVTRGVEQVIDRFRQVGTGEWCESREGLLRDFVAGTATEDQRRQAEHHLDHCRACAEFVARLNGQLHGVDAAAIVAILAAGGVSTAPLAGLIAWLRDLGGGMSGRLESVFGSAAGSATGTAGAGLAAKVVAGGGGKALLACLGTGVAATACIAAGVVPGVRGEEDPRPEPVSRGNAPASQMEPHRLRAAPPTTGVERMSQAVAAGDVVEVKATSRSEPVTSREGEAVETAPAPAPTAVEEFDPMAQPAPPSPSPPPMPEPAPTAASTSNDTTPAPADSAVAGEEFGP